MATQKNIFDFEPMQKFIKTLGKEIEGYFGRDKGALVYLKPDGVWYAEGLHQWLKKKKRDITITSMEDDGEGLEEEKVQGRKVLIVINESFSGKAYKRSMEAIRARKERLNIKGIKFAAYRDRPGTADFAVDQYSTEAIWHLEEIDAIDLKIISFLGENGRTSFAEIGKKINLSQVAVKNRIDSLLKKGILTIRGVLNIDRFYTISAGIHVDAEQKTVEKLIQNLQALQEVYHLVESSSGGYTLAIGLLARTVQEVEEFVEKHIRPLPDIRRIDIHIGKLPLVPNSIPPKLKQT